MNGSSRAPNRDFVRRTPLPTARIRPVRRVEHGDDVVGLTQVLGAQHDAVVAVLPHPAIVAHPGDGHAGARDASTTSCGCGAGRLSCRMRRIYRPRARLTADSTARRDAVTVLVSMPTPHRARPPTSHSTYAAAWASLPADSACSV